VVAGHSPERQMGKNNRKGFDILHGVRKKVIKIRAVNDLKKFNS